jgi:hypothetical protein
VEVLAINLNTQFSEFLGSGTKLQTGVPTDMTYAYGVLFYFVKKAKKMLHVACYSTSVNEYKAVIRLTKKTYLCM